MQQCLSLLVGSGSGSGTALYSRSDTTISIELREIAMAYVFGVPTLLFLAALLYGGITGRVRMSSCCSVADPSKDLRMRGAFEDAEISERPSR